MIKKILVPTDFSENALAATKYACKLAKKKNYAVHLFHCYTSSSALFDEEKENKGTSIPLMKADALMLDLKESLKEEYPEIVFESTCTSGLLSEILPTVGVAPNYALIIMGTTGAGKGKSLAWGSNTSIITSKSSIPVIAVPTSNAEFALNRVGMLTNFKAEELDTLKDYLALVAPISQLDIIHVYKNNRDNEEINEQLHSWSFNIKNLQGTENVESIAQPIQQHDEQMDTIPEVINNIIKSKDYDMIVVTKTRRSFFERLFRTSVSKKIILDLECPTFFDNN